MCLARPLSSTSLFEDRAFFLPRPANRRFHATNVQHDPAIPSSALLAPSVSSPCLNTLIKKLIFERLDHRVAGHCNSARRIKRGMGNCRSY